MSEIYKKILKKNDIFYVPYIFGILHVCLPKKEEAKQKLPKTIEIP